MNAALQKLQKMNTKTLHDVENDVDIDPAFVTAQFNAANTVDDIANVIALANVFANSESKTDGDPEVVSDFQECLKLTGRAENELPFPVIAFLLQSRFYDALAKGGEISVAYDALGSLRTHPRFDNYMFETACLRMLSKHLGKATIWCLFTIPIYNGESVLTICFYPSLIIYITHCLKTHN